MLVDAAKHGDVEIPVFCYEPKLGHPVGACRMCLVEIEGIPKLQTACSTPVRDGMVVYTRTDRVKAAQEAVVEFLLVNHPLDCPVCDKGGECPLQDIAMGWGPGRSRVIDPKRHFQKPIPLSPLIKIDRERCILCYRCVRFSQEIAEDEQLQLLDRGVVDLRGHLRRPPLHRPLPRQHHRALPGGGADLGRVPVPRPSLGHRGRRLDLHALPEPVQRDPDGARRADRARPRPRQPRGRRRLAMRQGAVRLPDGGVRAADRRAPGPPGRRASPRELGAGARGGGGRPSPGRGTHGCDRRRLLLERGGIPGSADRAPGPWLAACGLAAPVVHRPPPRDRIGAARAERRASPTSTRPSRSWFSAPTRCTRCRSSTCGFARSCGATAPGSPSPPTARAPWTAAPRRPPGTRPASHPASRRRWRAPLTPTATSRHRVGWVKTPSGSRAR